MFIEVFHAWSREVAILNGRDNEPLPHENNLHWFPRRKTFQSSAIQYDRSYVIMYNLYWKRKNIYWLMHNYEIMAGDDESV
jgi:hypothetical protein